MAEVVADGGEVADEQQIPMRWLTPATEAPPPRPKRRLLAFRPEDLVGHRRECRLWVPDNSVVGADQGVALTRLRPSQRRGGPPNPAVPFWEYLFAEVRELCEGASTGAFALFGLRLRIIGEGASWGGVLGARRR